MLRDVDVISESRVGPDVKDGERTITTLVSVPRNKIKRDASTEGADSSRCVGDNKR
ncbi:hypothetical protein C1H46_018867 [Malus baccata]|uniref:Uncharacterized protein n=1 Tax=Malus baccata TaxID=106549 RepID=A0A540M9W9_MALBA|nr:hypothetical protein C1H46_018867 [Malus baccata]